MLVRMVVFSNGNCENDTEVFVALTPDSTWARVWRSHLLDKLLAGNKEKKEEISNNPHHLLL